MLDRTLATCMSKALAKEDRASIRRDRGASKHTRPHFERWFCDGRIREPHHIEVIAAPGVKLAARTATCLARVALPEAAGAADAAAVEIR